MRRIASILSDLTHTTTDCSAVQPQQGRLHSCLVALDKATGDQEKQQEREFGMILEPRAEQLTTALQCVRSILGNISLHPDNEKLRRIRINHPAIKVCLCIIAHCVRVIVYDCVRMLSSLTQSLTQSVSHSLTQSVTHTVSHTVSQSLTHSLSHSHSQSVTHSLTHTVTQSLTQSLTHTVSQSVTHTVSQSLTHSLTQSVTHTVSQSHSPSHSQSVSHTVSQSVSQSVSHTVSHLVTQSVT
jgi:hypothetical protein